MSEAADVRVDPEPSGELGLAGALIALEREVRTDLEAGFLRMLDEEWLNADQAAKRFRTGVATLHGGSRISPLLKAAEQTINRTGGLQVDHLAATLEISTPELERRAGIHQPGRRPVTFEAGILAHNRVAATSELRDLLAAPKDNPDVRLVVDAAQAKLDAAAADRTAARTAHAADNNRWSRGATTVGLTGTAGILTGLGLSLGGLIAWLNPVPGIVVTLSSVAVAASALGKETVDSLRRHRAAYRGEKAAETAAHDAEVATAALFEPPSPHQGAARGRPSEAICSSR